MPRPLSNASLIIRTHRSSSQRILFLLPVTIQSQLAKIILYQGFFGKFDLLSSPRPGFMRPQGFIDALSQQGAFPHTYLRGLRFIPSAFQVQ